MFNEILWTLDNKYDPLQFERLCCDLLVREGYQNLNPIGGVHDRGRDAEIRLYKNINVEGNVTFFQFSLEEKWESKLKRELEKVRQNGHNINNYVFITSRDVTGKKNDTLRKYCFEKYNWILIIYAREWLRLQLEERYPDLAEKYLGVPVKQTAKKPIINYSPVEIPQDEKNIAWDLYNDGNYERAIIEFKELLRVNEINVPVLQALSWSQYLLRRYDEALVTINKAIDIDGNTKTNLSIKACILTEGGIKESNKAKLLIAKEIFRDLIKTSKIWVDHYNYGNVLSALGDYKKAEKAYKNAIIFDPQQAEIWKNLGSTYYHMGLHDKELECYDKAIEINENLPQAIISKGITIYSIFNKPIEAIELFNRAFEIDESIKIQWPILWYWLSKAYFDLSKYDQAIDSVNRGLELSHQNFNLLSLKANIYSELWRKNDKYFNEALTFFEFFHNLATKDSNIAGELIDLYAANNDYENAYSLFKNHININNELNSIEEFSRNIADYIKILKNWDLYITFRNVCPLEYYIEFFKENAINQSKSFRKRMWFDCSKSFCLACDYFKKIPIKNRKNSLKQLQSLILKELKIVLPKVSTSLINESDATLKDQQLILEIFSKILLIWPEISLREFSRQFGYISGYYGINNKIKDIFIQENFSRVYEWQRDILSESFLNVNKVFNLYKDK